MLLSRLHGPSSPTRSTSRRTRRLLSIVSSVLVVAELITGCSGGQRPSAPPAGVAAGPTGLPQVHVEGNHLVDDAGRTVQLRGVNRSGLEYSCIQGTGFFDGASDDASIAAIATWGANVVRLPLNEDCWLGISTPDPAYSGTRYQAAVSDYVRRLHRHGLAAVLDLQWTQDGAASATGTVDMPDAEHAPAFWTSVARTFAGDRAVLFDLFNEPRRVSWDCWRDGCTMPAGWQAAGMQTLVESVRGAGARQPILLGGLGYANDLDGLLDHVPHDPQGQLAVSFHVYNFNECNDPSCWNRTVAAAAERMPVVAGEVGSDQRTPQIFDEFLPWADKHGISYLGWAWNTWGEPTALISDYSGTPTAYGEGLRRHLQPAAPKTRPDAGEVSPVLSRNRPTFASGETYPAAAANSDDYSKTWRSTGYPCWLAYDLSGVPEAQRRRVYSQWTNTATYDYDASVFPAPTYNELGDYVIESNPGPGGGQPPESGWRTLTSVTGNQYHSAAHLLDLGGDSWLRLRATAGNPSNAQQNTDCALKWDIFPATDSVPDSWIFYGDSITAAALAPYPLNADASGVAPDSFAKQIAAARPGVFPAQQAGGVGGLALQYALDHGLLQRWLDAYPGRYVALAFGANDANNDGFDAAAFGRSLHQAVGLIEAAGKVPIVPTLVASRAPNLQAHGPAADDQIRQLYRDDSHVVPGPDLWSLTAPHSEWFGASDALHPNDAGYAAIRKAWVDFALAKFYPAGSAASAGRTPAVSPS